MTAETRPTYETHDRLNPTDNITLEKGSAIRRHLKSWQEQQAGKPEYVDLHKLPGFDVSGSIQNSMSQFGEVDPSASSIADEADLFIESEPQLDSEGDVGNIAPDPYALRSGDMAIILYVRSKPWDYGY